MTVPTPNSAALDSVPDIEPAVLTAEAPTKLAATTSLAATASPAAAATHCASTAAAPLAPGPGAGPPSNDRRIGAPEDDRPRGARPPRLRVGWHTMRMRSSVDAAELSELGDDRSSLRPPPLHSGLILGRDGAGHPVAVPMLTADPARVAVVGSRRLAQIVVLRTLALGAAAVITAADPPAWHGFGYAATGEQDRVVVLPQGRPVTAFGTADQPALVVCDLGDTAPAAVPQPWPSQTSQMWQTWLIVLSTLSDNARELAADCRFLLLECPERDGTLVLVQGGESRRVHLTPTAVERKAFGAPVTAPAGTTRAVPAARRPGA
ncbi:hypothetical protein [Catenulispora rubra]|uniref:hypothetical protein n=1 Tax=Catenulispora rubra TaxID=280293 RepID=UPI0018923B05|nr:hypothetical protein [Catenulispora rubra]